MTTSEIQTKMDQLTQRRTALVSEREQTAAKLHDLHARLTTQALGTSAINEAAALHSRLSALDSAALSLDPQIDAKRTELAIEQQRVEREQRAARLVEIAAERATAIEEYYSAAEAASAALQREVERMRTAVERFRDLGQEGRTLWQKDNERIPSDHIAVMADMPSREVEHGFAITTAYRTVESNLSDAIRKKINSEREQKLVAERQRIAQAA